MKNLRHTRFILFIIFLFYVLLECFAGAQGLKQTFSKSEQEPIIIKANTLEVIETSKQIIFTGEVNAKKEDFVIDCQKMVVHYKNRPALDRSEGVDTSIEKIIATGKVRITRAQGGEATANEAVYYPQDEKIVLSDNPVVVQGKDFVEGDRITIFLKENRSVVESEEDKKVRAIIFPKREKR
ncbi:MAG TPA: lipopolysaccharide transport periplasmic protein LptA [Desulfobacteraceae bacterium]|nr:lipopolysaccharide transport periplasmic protein LptA [Desulfobacteraceae bacterium]HPJ66334.1 lipopolysaccharide transport periplasmic protein LptA [Desulfobacteraceae bacterium]HPQ27178.1 lipopolysaccharide transport periplasmic protein LptA [Desulfobacteraceae bacterium]